MNPNMHTPCGPAWDAPFIWGWIVNSIVFFYWIFPYAKS